MDEYQAFQPPAAVLDDAPAGALELAERGTRLAAVILDALIFGSVGLVAAIAIPALLMARRGHAGTALGVGLIGLMGAWFLVVSIWNAVWVHRYGQTIGKRIMKIRVVRSNGERATFARIFFLRNVVLGLAGAVPFIGGFISLADILMIFRDSRQCLHDQLADTLVIRA